MKTFKLPDLGEGLQEAEIVEWYVKAGDQVEVDQLLVSVETAKAIVEVPSPQAGVLARCFGQPGDPVHVGEPLVTFDGEADDSGTVVGNLARADAGAGLAAEEFHIGMSPSTRDFQPARATPSLRRLAQQLDVDLSRLHATTPSGLIREEDVRRAADPVMPGAGEALRSVRRTMAKNMARAHAEVVPVMLVEDADLHAWTAPVRDPMIRLVRAIGIACAAQPALNAGFDGRRLTLQRQDKIDLGVAVDTPDGLFVPVLRDIAGRDPADLRAGLAQLRADVAKRSIPPRELMGATITLSNFGTLFGRYANPIVMPPQVAIIGAGTLREEPVAWEGQVVIHPILPLSLTFDHRAVTGGEAARFLKALVSDLQLAE
ncbi:dihydrolipoamide acetyltransferase family protein [Halopseudomonas pelagia]|uniref:dihydrolipoamide acetyltransferase family protein n=1 Tax=Halopseudomonas pelagia TaxID=553151 RepID=UPI00039A1F65|nr:dihydrolipoamide acetyltransferase family protein [Halopseudomonas pelagia]|tara:strand:- start:4 stop:1122 length:1119 start_codon:yes stop_codon:yes gene_type:complete